MGRRRLARSRRSVADDPTGIAFGNRSSVPAAFACDGRWISHMPVLKSRSCLYSVQPEALTLPALAQERFGALKMNPNTMHCRVLPAVNVVDLPFPPGAQKRLQTTSHRATAPLQPHLPITWTHLEQDS
ncbi:hypothetical protein AAFF_G00265290 [Aldrovandia affinis]|uniref:Uncharacterized protein n=1 Tax=Aldrovandia affinis TaxID=143900 RepID=A0AAD7RBR7_9TELE|nr:hypothetical protein AAFF_G00265290 [Aldrovandia affinis]